MDRERAARIERAGALDMESYVVAARDSGVYPDAASFNVAGGVAAWFSTENVLNGAVGLGMNGRVDLEAVAALESFYRERGTRPMLDICPLADPSLTAWIAERGFVPVSYENVLVRVTDETRELPQPDAGVEVCEGDEVDRAVWADLVARGFTEDQPTPEDHRVARASSMRDDAVRFVAFVDGAPAGTGMFSSEGGIGHLNGDATLPSLRGRGAQRALIAARLRHAAARGIELVYVETTPGSGSQRNMERLGFRLAYTRVSVAIPDR